MKFLGDDIVGAFQKFALIISATVMSVFGTLWLLSYIKLDLYTVIIAVCVSVTSTSLFKNGFKFIENYLQSKQVIEHILENFGSAIAEKMAEELSAEIVDAWQDDEHTITIKIKSGV